MYQQVRLPHQDAAHLLRQGLTTRTRCPEALLPFPTRAVSARAMIQGPPNLRSSETHPCLSTTSSHSKPSNTLCNMLGKNSTRSLIICSTLIMSSTANCEVDCYPCVTKGYGHCSILSRFGRGAEPSGTAGGGQSANRQRSIQSGPIQPQRSVASTRRFQP